MPLNVATRSLTCCFTPCLSAKHGELGHATRCSVVLIYLFQFCSAWSVLLRNDLVLLSVWFNISIMRRLSQRFNMPKIITCINFNIFFRSASKINHLIHIPFSKVNYVWYAILFPLNLFKSKLHIFNEAWYIPIYERKSVLLLSNLLSDNEVNLNIHYNNDSVKYFTFRRTKIYPVLRHAQFTTQLRFIFANFQIIC